MLALKSDLFFSMMETGRKTDHPTVARGKICWSGSTLALHLFVLTMGQGLTCTRKAIAIFEQMFYNPLHTERKWETESKGKGKCVDSREEKLKRLIEKIEKMNEDQLRWFIDQALRQLDVPGVQSDRRTA